MLGHSEGSDIWKISYQHYYQGRIIMMIMMIIMIIMVIMMMMIMM